MRRRDLLLGLAALPVLGGCAAKAPAWVHGPAAQPARRVALPDPTTRGARSLEQALRQRRSQRSFRPDPLPQAVVGQLLWAGQGVTAADGKRAAPSAGALYPLELYVVTADAVLHYVPAGHVVERRAAADLRPQLQAAALDQPAVGAAPAVLVVAAVPDRTRRKYGTWADSFVDREAGHVAQNILLQATVLDLAAVPIGSVDPHRAAAVLGLPPGEHVVYLIPVGRAP